MGVDRDGAGECGVGDSAGVQSAGGGARAFVFEASHALFGRMNSPNQTWLLA